MLAACFVQSPPSAPVDQYGRGQSGEPMAQPVRRTGNIEGHDDEGRSVMASARHQYFFTWSASRSILPRSRPEMPVERLRLRYAFHERLAFSVEPRAPRSALCGLLR